MMYEKVWAEWLETDPILFYILKNDPPLPDNIKKNSILLKNLAVGFVRAGISSRDARYNSMIYEVIQNIHHNVSELIGWMVKVERGEIKKYNIRELNKWIKDYGLKIKPYAANASIVVVEKQKPIKEPVVVKENVSNLTIDEILCRKRKSYIEDMSENEALDYLIPKKYEIVIYEKNGIEEVDLVEIIRQICPKFVQDQFSNFYVELDNELLSIKSDKFKAMLSGIYYGLVVKTLSSDKKNAIIATLESHGYTHAEKRNLENRLTWEGDPPRILYDLCNDRNELIQIQSVGWSVVDREQPLIFKKWAHQKPQIIPKQENNIKNIELLRPFFTVSDKDWALLKVYVCSLFIPDIPHPVICTYGPPGSGKSSISRTIKRLIDPSVIETAALPGKQDELIQKMSHHCFLSFDNLTEVEDWQSDILCRAVTKEGFSKRKLYSDQDDVFFEFRSSIGLNGVNLSAQKSDLLDRSILIEVERISMETRKPERVLERKFKSAKPKILDAIWTIVAKSFDYQKQITMRGMPFRMADFAIWGEAISLAMGNDEGDFMRVYEENLGKQSGEAVSASSIGDVLMAFMNEVQEWSGTSADLYKAIEAKAEDMGVNTRDRDWPKAPNALKRKINEIKTNLKDEGLEFEDTHDGKRRTVSLILTEAKGSRGLRAFANDTNDKQNNIVMPKLPVRPKYYTLKENIRSNAINDDLEKVLEDKNVTNQVEVSTNTPHIKGSEKTVNTVKPLESAPDAKILDLKLNDIENTHRYDTVKQPTPTPSRSIDYLTPGTTWSLRDIILDIFDIYGGPLGTPSQTQFKASLNRCAFITHGDVAYKVAISEGILEESPNGDVIYVPIPQVSDESTSGETKEAENSTQEPEQ